MKQDSARVIFPNKDTMLELLSDLKLTKSLAGKKEKQEEKKQMKIPFFLTKQILF